MARELWEDVPQRILVDVLETSYAITIHSGPAGDVHFDYLDRSEMFLGWDLNAAWVPAGAIEDLCDRLRLEGGMKKLYKEIRKHTKS